MSRNTHAMIGQMLDPVHRVERVLGRGSMGAVYAARNIRTGGMFAIKVLHPHAAQDAEIYARFRNEARVTSALRHPGIVQTFDFAQLPDGSPCIIMEYLVGEDLHVRLRRLSRLLLDEALGICRQVAEALHAAHLLQIVHRDLKPGNIFLLRQAPLEPGGAVTEQAKIIDFGVSRIRGVLAAEQQTQDMHIIGTPQYMSPEAALGLNSQLDGRSDQFSLAVILYRMLTGRLPFDNDNQVVVLHLIAYEPAPPINRLLPDLPAHLVSAIHRGLSKRKEQRFDTVLDFAAALQGPAAMDLLPVPTRVLVQSSVDPSPTRLTPLTPLTPSLSAEVDRKVKGKSLLGLPRRRFLFSLAGGGLLGAAAIGALLWNRPRPVPADRPAVRPVETQGAPDMALFPREPSPPQPPPAPPPIRRPGFHGGHRPKKEGEQNAPATEGGSQIRLRNPFDPIKPPD